MKRFWIFFSLIFFLFIMLSSCYVNKPPCPAYGDASEAQMHAVVADDFSF